MDIQRLSAALKNTLCVCASVCVCMCVCKCVCVQAENIDFILRKKIRREDFSNHEAFLFFLGVEHRADDVWTDSGPS